VEARTNHPISSTAVCFLVLWGVKDEKDMRSAWNFGRNLLMDETGGEVLEYALVAGLIVIAAISLISKVGSKVLARWTSLNAAM
jgi:pilus assembly protein Flp/PilA